MISAAIERCAGIDVGKKFLAVCVMVGPLEGEPRVEIRKFGTIRVEGVPREPAGSEESQRTQN